VKRSLLLFVFLLIPFTSLSAQQDEETAVREVVNRYLHGLKFNDVESFRQAFMPDAKLYFFTASAGKEEQGELRIAALEVHRDIATVKVVEDYPGNPGSRYTDYLNMVKYGGRWWIVNKVYTSERL